MRMICEHKSQITVIRKLLIQESLRTSTLCNLFELEIRTHYWRSPKTCWAVPHNGGVPLSHE